MTATLDTILTAAIIAAWSVAGLALLAFLYLVIHDTPKGE